MLESFPAYLLPQTGKFDSIFEELREYKFKKRPVYSASVIRFALLLQYTSIQDFAERFPFTVNTVIEEDLW